MLDALEANLKTLVTLHKEAMLQGDAGVVTAIDAGVGSFRNTVVNWSCKDNRTVGGGRKRTATDPVDMRNLSKNKRIESRKKRSAMNPRDYGNTRGRRQQGSRDLALFEEEGLRSGGGGSCVKSEGDVGGDRLTSEGSAGGTNAKSEDGGGGGGGESCEGVAGGSVGSADGERGAGVGVTLTAKDVEDAKELVQKLMGYFSQ